ncbi:uncharacterized protein BP5553_10232 [Venustampulla echinocandica]|uniref:tRNA-splicing endonuclease subunit Sen34 n=1 Tax=Venustampulla echinocandica TaxID=2656787 RepID=A0A370T9L6_9HELO|nr:uncharacterized protein BP5553_10232 [Venustampulla echinocandica]RDL30354.1 hypothetical protein BP5553_10232 [Venustampulla echinocandica]
MALLSDPVSEPVPISLISGRYLLFDIDVVTYLRRTHHICGSFIGGIPQAPQQNVFLGLPIQLTPEEVKVLIENEVAYIIDDSSWHKERFSTLQGADRKKYLESLRAEGLKASRLADATARKRSENALAKQAVLKASKEAAVAATKDPSEVDSTVEPDPDVTATISDNTLRLRDDGEEEIIFSSEEIPSSPEPSKASGTSKPYAITPTTSYPPSSLPQNPSQQPDPIVPISYPLFAHLHAHNYYIMPGLRFGCDYNVYPGDPLRFHSHFLATGYEWNQDISMLDLIGGGRLGTAVKKGFMIGAEDKESEAEGDNVRTFTIEWAGM